MDNQRICIARALAVEHVLLMDEPKKCMDTISKTKVEELINELKETYTMVCNTQYTESQSC